LGRPQGTRSLPTAPSGPDQGEAMTEKSLYERLGGYDAISAVAGDLLPRLQADPELGRFWRHRGEDGVAREKQLLVDFLCSSAGGPVYYTGRDMKTSHRGMRISERDWSAFLQHLDATLDRFQLPGRERDEVVGFVRSTKADIVEV
jgi:hemoglobin